MMPCPDIRLLPKRLVLKLPASRGDEGLAVRIVEGLSFLEPTFSGLSALTRIRI